MKPLYKKLLVFSGASLFTLLLLGAIGVLIAYAYLTPRLPSIDTLKDVRLQVPLRVYARTGELIAEFGEMKRTPLSYDQFPDLLIKAVLAAEDDRFFEHPGVDYQGILRAAFHLVRTGERAQGGSTITMQVARNFFLSREKTYLRKLNEILLALKIENTLTKQQILELYLNKIYLGKRSYGFAAAAQVYYGRSLAELELSELAMIAGLPKAPSSYNPVANPERAVIRRNYVLGRMFELELIDEATHTAAVNARDIASVHGLAVEVEAPYVAEMVRAEMLARFGGDSYSAGYKVYTTIEPQRQRIANTALRNALLAYGRRHGYRGVISHLELIELELHDPQSLDALLADIPTAGGLLPALVLQVSDDDAYAYTQGGRIAYLPFEERLSWASRFVDDTHRGPEPKNAREVLREGDIILVQSNDTGCSWLAEVPEVAGALVSLNPDDGAVRALVGGFDFYQSKFNRVVQAKRQPGSSFKPFIYSAALDKGFTAASVINDAPVVFDAPGLEDTWRPENYTGRFYGPTRLRKALVKSRNLVSIRLLRDIGIGYAVRYASQFGFSPQDLPRDLSLALGSGSLTPLELATGFAVFANGGYRVTPYVISHVVGPDGQTVLRTVPGRVCPDCIPLNVQDASISSSGPDGAVAESIDDSLSPSQDGAGTGVEAEPSGGLATPLFEAGRLAPVVPRLLVTDDADAAATVATVPAEAGVTEATGVLAPMKAEETTPPPVPPLFIGAPQILTPQTNFVMNTMLRDVIRAGTGVRARALGRNDLAGKTGTTNEQQDAWFSGFSRDVVTTTWVGFDNPRPLGDRETGGRAALPMWMEYMAGALQGKPAAPLVQPPGIVSVRIDAKSGRLAGPNSKETLFEYFLADQAPTERQVDGQIRTTEQGEGDVTEQLF
jgi:penicillin-binding protein 1A